MAEAKPLKYPGALILEKGNRIRIISKSTIWQCILDIQSKYKQNPEKPSKLKESQLKKFKKSCFGTLFLRMRELVLSSGIIHNMVARQADSLNTEVMKFNFNDKESYNATIISMHRALGLRQGKLNESATYSLCGFPLAFQVWGYETIPLMGDLYANKIGDSFPRIYNWEDKGHTIFFRQVGIDIFGNNQLYVIGRLRAINADEEFIYKQNENCPIPPLEQYVNEGPTNFDHEHEGFSYYHQQQHASNVEIPTIDDFARPSTSSHYFDELKSHIDTRFDHMANDFSSYRLDSMRELQSIDMKVERMAIDVQSIDMGVDRMATEFSEFRFDTM
ncbi:hypothetical protein FNV43_RR10257 [Rhamnella rubrinervis]|uniref:Uncharacterized protein n=1 Tax=Rhamnella rubrinervis TaxID=2594499 RepID=A0A8K0MKZ1_9ROSA|nr:hypothetical protein FNV43_RR10257 [Rhamnella rubrinervis]